MMVELTYHINPNSVTLSSSDTGGTLSKRDDSRESSFGHPTLMLRLTGNTPFHFATQDEREFIL